MKIIVPANKAMILAIIVLMIVSAISLPVASAATVDANDGVFTDSFENDDYIDQTNTDCQVATGTVTLPNQDERVYEFNGDEVSKAYSFKSLFFTKYFQLAPSTNILYQTLTQEFSVTDPLRVEEIKTRDNVYYSTSSELLRRTIGHHFRIKMDIEPDMAEDITIDYHGRVDLSGSAVTMELKMYVWQQPDIDTLSRGQWIAIENYTVMDMVGFTISTNVPEGIITNGLDGNNYLDILILAKMADYDSWLRTDNIKITCTGVDGYSTNSARVASIPIDPVEIANESSFYWDQMSWEDSTKGDSSITYQLYHVDKDGVSTLIDDIYLPGNDNGFKDSPVSLSGLPSTYRSLQIKATLETSNPSFSPKIYSWTLTWQSDVNAWNDQFNSTARISSMSKTELIDGIVRIRPVQGDWPSVGGNSQNTHASQTVGPKDEGGRWIHQQNDLDLGTPIIKNGYVYIPATDKTDTSTSAILRYDVLSSSDGILYTGDILIYEIDSPIGDGIVATDDGSIIVATALSGDLGTSNKILCLSEDLSLKWETANYPNTCFTAAPMYDDGLIYLTTWDGKSTVGLSESDSNNLIILDAYDGTEKYDSIGLPAGSSSTPAIGDELILVGCDSSNDNTLIAIDRQTKDILWNISIGNTDTSSPVIYDDYAILIHKSNSLTSPGTKLTVISILDGVTVWQKTLSTIFTPNTPAVFDNVVYVCSRNGDVTAFDIVDGTMIWETNVHPSNPLIALTTSPAYSDGLLYISTPYGSLYALETETGTTEWDTESNYFDEELPGFITSPIVSNGLVFVIDETNVLYSIGDYEEPNEGLTGEIFSVPIKRPAGKWWNTFRANYTSNKNNSILFQIIDDDGLVLKEAISDEPLSITNDDTIRLKATFTANNVSNIPELHSWGVTFTVDDYAPVLDVSSMIPKQENNTVFSNEIISRFILDVRDNITGLIPSSAQYEFQCSINHGQIQNQGPYSANCTGEIATTDTETMTIDLTELAYFDNITSISGINISIYDRAGNEAEYSLTVKQDTGKPVSTIKKDQLLDEYDDTAVINATVQDPAKENEDASGVDYVDLHYKHSRTESFTGDWMFYGRYDYTTTDYMPTWDFNADDEGGYYQLCTIATDVLGNSEEFPENGSTLPTFLFDSTPPSALDFGDTIWYSDLPTIELTFEDDYNLDTIQYRLSGHTTWETIATDINRSTYSTPFTLDSSQWSEIDDGDVVEISFKITDSLGNERTLMASSALEIGKDMMPPIVGLSKDIEGSWTWEDSIIITAEVIDPSTFGEASGITTVTLYYRYNSDPDAMDESDWESYDEPLEDAPYEWEFQSDKDGYYDFKIVTEDAAGNTVESEILPTGFNVLPTAYIAAMAVLAVMLIGLSMVIVVRWSGKRKND